MDSFRNHCQNHNKSYKYICSQDNEVLCDKCLQLQTIHRSHDIKLLKDEKETHFGSIEDTQLKQKMKEINNSIVKMDKAIESVKKLYDFLNKKRNQLEKQEKCIEEEIDKSNRCLLESRSSHQSFDSFCEKKSNKYTTTANFRIIKDAIIEKDQKLSLSQLLNDVIKKLGFQNKQFQSSHNRLFSPKYNKYDSIKSKPFNLQSPKSPKSPKTNITFTPNSPKFLNSNLKYKLSPQPTTILQKLRRQKEDFNVFKSKFNY